ncbi:MAG: hypothetical protein WC957_00835 [Candidatus Neomarinimicrobiota bacterium]|jgi:hypothetical protein
MKLYLRVNNPKGMTVGFRDLKTGKINAGYKLFFDVCKIDIPDAEGEEIVGQNPHIVSKTAKDLAPHIVKAEENRLQSAIKMLVDAGYTVTKAGAVVTPFVPATSDGAGNTGEKPGPVSNEQALKVLEELEKLGDLHSLKKKELADWAVKLGLPVTSKDTAETLVEKIAGKSAEVLG